MIISRNTIERLHASTSLSMEEWTDCLRVSPHNYQQMLKLPEISLGDQLIEDLSEMVELTPEAIASGNIDFKVLAMRQAGNVTVLPERYSEAAHSKIRTSSHVLDYVEISHGWRMRNYILRHFQLNESIFSNLDRTISIHFLADLCIYLEKLGLGRTGFYNIGKYSAVTNSNNAVGKMFREIGKPQLAYEVCFTDIIGKYYDQNSIYSLKGIKNGICRIEADPHPKVVEELGGLIPGNKGACASRGGTFSSIMGYIGAPDAKVNESTCIHDGDSCCTYTIDFREADSVISHLN